MKALLSRVLVCVIASAPFASRAGAGEVIPPEKITTLTWNYTLSPRALEVRACGRYRPGEREQCATGTLKDGPKGGLAIDRILEMLRLPRDRVGIGIQAGAGSEFQITALTYELLSAPGIGEKAARGDEIELSGESLTKILWVQDFTSREIMVRVCGKLASPEMTGCVELVEKGRTNVRRLKKLLLQSPVEQLAFRIAWDGAKRSFLRLQRITSPSQ
jgi:hypothetical protein